MHDQDYWQKQGNQALYPDILWSRPENKAGAGKLSIVGGNANAFSAPGIAYDVALQAGAGVVQVLLPDAIRKTVKYILPDAEYGSSNPSGSFSKLALSQFTQASSWSDMALIAGDLGRNSETAALLESYVQIHNGLVTITQDAADYFKETPSLVVDRPNTLLVLTVAQLQRIFIATPSITPITYSMSSSALAEALHEYTLEHPVAIMTLHNGFVFVSYGGSVVTSPAESNPPEDAWRIKTAAKAAVYWMQSPDKIFESIVTSLLSHKSDIE